MEREREKEEEEEEQKLTRRLHNDMLKQKKSFFRSHFDAWLQFLCATECSKRGGGFKEVSLKSKLNGGLFHLHNELSLVPLPRKGRGKRRQIFLSFLFHISNLFDGDFNVWQLKEIDSRILEMRLRSGGGEREMKRGREPPIFRA